MRITLIAAMAKNRVIGRDNAMPWHLPADFAWFKRHTLGHPVIMGRKTAESIGRPLPGRRNLVVTRNPGWARAGWEAFASLDDALAACAGSEEVFVIGGAQVYAEALPRADRVLLTEVDCHPPGDALFPLLSPDAWRETGRAAHARDENNAFDMAFVTLERARPPA